MRRAHLTSNIVWHQKLDMKYRQDKTKSKGFVIWFTGLSASGKSSVASLVEKKLVDKGRMAYLLDGDNIRHGLCSDLGFSEEHRMENIRRLSEVAALLEDSGVIAIVSAITPLEEMRNLAKSKAKKFILVYVKAEIDTCIKRDPKGLYKKALEGEIKGYTGIDSPFEEPEQYDILLDTDKDDVLTCADKVMEYIQGVL
ncbi:MAG TPA: adenylyl-sulfate kinase [Clostridia bacterium]|jgi:adenylylsulfate kinase|nr:adenylyl-sulfate kinase [Clostridia bacterium]MDD4503082.1 adenylyl-sulfate kinase [Clostridia bacterium]NLV34125.1 adenylyl-sulfate kinase [Clostridiaceae bacterium]HQM95938.1 adenylyl-sulfate kinase [Clostridia bacterium]HQO70220.1 adenylyl-sulfate kinase [Clostridia bacterium]